ncbi:MAG: hypothetical protein DMG72_08300 [Acidobacteria bacterium]|nr:MAG: hypothetical protein DMG72_08300 [Acidobacteriota bacterium]
MIASATLDSPLVYTHTESGASEPARLIAEHLRVFCEHYSKPRRQILEPEIMALLGSDAGNVESVVVNDETARNAVAFAMLLPRAVPIPEVAPDPDGEISFDWIGKSGRMFSVSIGADGRISYAGRFGDKSKTHGIEQLSEVCPREILFGIEKALR